MSNKTCNLYVVSGPSGAGKGTICDELLLRKHDLALSVSATTRQPRHDEIHGVDYFYISHQQFLDMIANDQLLEYDQHFDNYYGTPAQFVYDSLASGKHVLCEIDIAGALQIKKKYPHAILFFVQAPSMEELRARLEKRHSETEEQINLRLQRVDLELRYRPLYDYVIVNDNLERATNEILSIMKEIEK